MDKLKALRELMADEGVNAFLIPRTDAYQGEYIDASSARLEWLTGFTGSAGFAVVTQDKAAFFTDGRYTLQAKTEVPDVFEHYNYAQKTPATWVSENVSSDDKIAYDPWLFTESQAQQYGRPLTPLPSNLIDKLWTDRPKAPSDFIVIHPLEFAGESGESKRKRILERMQADQVLITTCDSTAWVLNIRGFDVPCNPIAHSICLLRKDGSYDLFIDLNKIEATIFNYIRMGRGRAIDISQILTHLKTLKGSCQIDPQSTPVLLSQTLEDAGVTLIREKDPCVLPKAIKNEVELRGAQEAHIQDGLALCRFLAWLEKQPLKDETTELSAAQKLHEFRKKGQHFKDLSFEAISAFGSHGAIIHYRVTPELDVPLKREGIYLLDSGGQYLTGTTDVTRTVVLGEPTSEQKDRYTRVLKGHIALAKAVFPEGVSGFELDVLARQYLWQVGCDYEHGTGHGVGSYLNVHEGPQNISRRAMGVPLVPGMLVSNEPGFYKEGEYGIRIESIVTVIEVPKLKGFYGFETLTLAPIDTKLIELSLLTEAEKTWLNDYNGRVFNELSPHLDEGTAAWLKEVTRNI